MVDLAGTPIQLIKGGSGAPLLIIEGEMGHHGWLGYHEALARNHTLHLPAPPGFGKSPRVEWVMNVRDAAGVLLEAVDDMGLGPVDLMGFSLGGWLAAEMASMSPHSFNKLVLVGAAGMRPPTGEIYDMFVVTAKEFITEGFLDPANTGEFQRICPDEPSPELAEAWEVAREEACRLSWKPYMFYLGMPGVVRRLKSLPTLIVWGRQDPIVPLSAGQLYNESITGSQLVVLDDCGHHPEVEKTDEFVRAVDGFLSGA
jgi:pimeloyl-ACP methyl ester carboxylesterase